MNLQRIFYLFTLCIVSFSTHSQENLVKKISGTSTINFWERHQASAGATSEALLSIWMNNDFTEGWAVGYSGEILKYNGTTWERHQPSAGATSEYLNSIWMNENLTEGWAVGSSGEILKYNETIWEQHQPSAGATSEALLSIWMNENLTEGWAVGRSGEILKYNGTIWEQHQPSAGATSEDLDSIWMNENLTEGWAVGRSGEILKYNGTIWEQHQPSAGATSEDLLSIWMNENLTEGWAVGRSGEILKYNGTIWEQHQPSAGATSEALLSIWMNENLTEGWAVGSSGEILKYNGTIWERHQPSAGATSESLSSIWMNEDLTEGWAVGSSGEILKYNGTTWERHQPSAGATSEALLSIWMNNDFTEGWAVGYSGEILKYNGTTWERHQPSAGATSEALISIWMNENLTEGWAVGSSGEILKYNGTTWERHQPSAGATSEALISIWMNENLTEGWAVGSSGEILKYNGTTWERHKPSAGATSEDLISIWMNNDFTEGWAVGDDGEILKYNGTTWERHQPSARATSESLSSIWMNEDLTEGWAVGDNGEILKYNGTTWERHQPSAGATSAYLNSIWMNENLTEGWAVGSSGEILKYNGTTWEQHQPSAGATFQYLYSIWMNEDLTEGWAVGWSGEILTLTNISGLELQLINNDPEALSKLNGTFKLKIKYPVDSPNKNYFKIASNPFEIKLINKTNDARTTVINPGYYEINPINDKSDEFELSFDSSFLRGLEQDECFLSFKLNYGFREAIYSPEYETTPTFIIGRPPWHYIAYISVLLICFYLVLVIAATRVKLIRRIILDPVGSSLLGLYFGKVLWIDFLIRFITPLRMGMFRDYRKNLIKAPYLNKWKAENYIQPVIRFRNNDKYTTPKEVLDEIIKGPKGKLSLIIGVSGLGKTALLENWTIYALNRGHTPVYIPLGSDLKPEQEAAAVFSQYGEVNIKPEAASDLIKNGGFIVFLDGFNEDQTPEATREFVRLISKRNHVIMTSQFNPGWERILQCDFIELSEFGRVQLEELLDKEWVDSLLESDLAPLARLPNTAELISDYIAQNKKLPLFHLDIYRNLRKEFDNDGQAINLELKAWEMFKINDKSFKHDNLIPSLLCEQAVKYGILTKRDEHFQFRHERIFRFFVACYINRQDDKPLEAWHSEISDGLGRLFWADVLEFIFEIKAEQAIKDSKLVKDLIDYLKEVGAFSIDIFKDRLYPMYIRLYKTGKIEENQEFIKWSAELLSDFS